MGTLPEELQPRNVCERRESKEDEQYIIFFGKDSPLSNFYHAEFTINGKKYLSVEQYFVYNKAMLAKAPKLASEILNVEDPKKIKRMGKSIKLEEAFWITHGSSVMEEGLRAKFQQNQALRDILVETCGHILVEGSRDRFWGCGHHLYSKEAIDRTRWEGENKLGEMLRQLRAEFA